MHGSGGGGGMTFAGGQHGHDGGAYDDVAADLMEQGSVRLHPHHQLALLMGEQHPVEEERRQPPAKKRSPPAGHSRRPTMKFGKVFLTGLMVGLSLVYFVTTSTSLPMDNAMRIAFLFIALAPVLVLGVGHMLLQRAEGSN